MEQTAVDGLGFAHFLAQADGVGTSVLTYNAFNRRNRMWLARLESFAHDLYVLLTVKNGRR